MLIYREACPIFLPLVYLFIILLKTWKGIVKSDFPAKTEVYCEKRIITLLFFLLNHL